MKAFDGAAAAAEEKLEEEFYQEANKVIAEKITPFYNFCILIFAAVFAYFIVIE